MLLPSGNQFRCHEEVLYLQPLIPPKRFDSFSPLTGRCSEGLDAFRFFVNTHGQCFQQQSGRITLQSFLINKPKFLKAAYHTEKMKIEIPKSMVVEALSW